MNRDERLKRQEKSETFQLLPISIMVNRLWPIEF